MSGLREQIAKKLNELSGLREKYGEMTIDVLIIQLESLIGKCATPTFSGGEVSIDYQEAKKFHDKIDKIKPTEQKEYCECGSIPCVCKVRVNQPEPKPKEKCKHDGRDRLGTCIDCGEKYMQGTNTLKISSLEPKPKDRIEPLDFDYPDNLKSLNTIVSLFKDKINEIIIRHINKES